MAPTTVRSADGTKRAQTRRWQTPSDPRRWWREPDGIRTTSVTIGRPTFTVDDGAGGTLVTYRNPDRVSRLALDKAAEMFAGRGVTTATAAQWLEAASPFHQLGVSALRKQLNRNPPVGWAKTGRGEWKRR